MRYDEIVAEGYRVFEQAKIDKRWLNLGSETQSQNRINRSYIDSLTIETRVLGSEIADTATTMFGVKLPSPIMPAPIIGSRVLEKLVRSEVWPARTSYGFNVNYMEEFARGVQDAGSIMWWGVNSESETVARLVESGLKAGAIIKPLRDKAKVLDLFRWAQKVGCIAVGMDIDAMFFEKAMDEYEGPREHGGQTVADLVRYRKATNLPFVVKGILSVHDAKIAVEEIGADAIVVSNHGGEVIDYTVPVLKVLPEIRKAVGKKTTIIVDSGLMRGSDAFKALALGANGAYYGSLLILSFAAYGRDGVAKMLQILNGELTRIMSYTGFKNVAAIEPSILHHSSSI